MFPILTTATEKCNSRRSWFFCFYIAFISPSLPSALFLFLQNFKSWSPEAGFVYSCNSALAKVDWPFPDNGLLYSSVGWPVWHEKCPHSLLGHLLSGYWVLKGMTHGDGTHNALLIPYGSRTSAHCGVYCWCFSSLLFVIVTGTSGSLLNASWLISERKVPLSQAQRRGEPCCPAVQISLYTIKSAWCSALSWAQASPWLPSLPSSKSTCANMPGRSCLGTCPSKWWPTAVHPAPHMV